MNKRLILCLGICIILCSASVLAQKANVKSPDIVQASQNLNPASAVSNLARVQMPDLTVTSASVTGQPVKVQDLLMVPLQITVRNSGGSTTADFNVGAQGRAVDGNAYGYLYYVPGENQMADPRSGVLVNGLAGGASKTFNGFLIMRAQPINQPLNIGTRYQITAMVDYNLDPDSFGYTWGVKESNENNNQLVINYP
ncbi:MAG: hypothetical protein ACE14P_12120 [Methanotrichaceae archaeon]